MLGLNMEKFNKSFYQVLVWILALVIGTVLGYLNINILNKIFNFTADIFTRCFQFLAVPVIAVSVITALSKLSEEKNMGRIFKHTVFYTFLTTFLAALTGLILFLLFIPDKIIVDNNAVNIGTPSLTYSEHLLSIIPKNLFEPLISGNVLSVILLASIFGIGLSYMKETENKTAIIKTIYGFQELLYTLINGLIKILPIGIAAFAAKLTFEITNGSLIGTLGKYTLIVLSGNLIQIFIILPLFLFIKKINPINTFKQMLPALITAFFTKSSAGTLSVTLNCAENNLKINPKISRFVLPICTTVNMNGCAAFILITSMFVMYNSGFELTISTMILWVFIAVFAAIGNAGVPMGCYFLTLSLMSSIGAPLGLLGIILPIYTIIDMVETMENVWSDSVVCTVVNKDIDEI